MVANGSTPYLELKTAYGWNMYANLRTVDGDSNHFVVRCTLPLTDEQADLVRIISTDDPGLALYADDDYALDLAAAADLPVASTPACGSPTRGATEPVSLVARVGRPGARRAASRCGGRSCCCSGPSTSQSPERCVPAVRARTLTGPVRDRR